jgi:hypothetical protein
MMPMRARSQPTFNVYVRLDPETERARRDLQALKRSYDAGQALPTDTAAA